MKRAWRAALLPWVIGAVLVATGHRLGWVVAVIGLLRFQLAPVAPEADAALDRWLGRAVTAASRALTAVLFFVPALLTVLAGGVGRLLGTDPLHRSTGWSPVSAAGGPRSERARGRPIRVSVAAVVIVFLAVAMVWIVRGRSSDEPEPTAGARPRQVEALRGQRDIEQVQLEEGEVFRGYEPDAVAGWTLPARFEGAAVNVEDRRRRTVQAADHGPLVWLFGGSTVFGSNQRDDRTIASRLAAISTAGGRPVRVVNWGRHAFTAYQEAQLLEQELRRADELPDLVVFYDGYNDVAVGLGASFLEAPSTDPPRAPSIVDGAPLEPRSGQPRWQTPEERYDRIVASYRRAGDLARSAAAAHGIDVVQVWQPTVFTRPLTAGERAPLAHLGLDPQALRTLRAAHEEIRERLPSDVVDLADAYDEAPPVFVDQVHTNELGADLAAAALSSALEDRLDSLER